MSIVIVYANINFKLCVYHIFSSEISEDTLAFLNTLNSKIIRNRKNVNESTFNNFVKTYEFIDSFLNEYENCKLNWTEENYYGNYETPIQVTGMYNFDYYQMYE